MTGSRRRTAALLVAGGFVFLLLVFALGGGATDVATDASATTSTPIQDDADIIISGDVDRSDRGEAAARFSDLPAVTLDALPPEALEVLERIEDGGPYRYAQDDGVFGNREGILPDRPPGHYREYTVATPGSDDRGARRIVAGADGERYWTEDHYASFAEIVFEVG